MTDGRLSDDDRIKMYAEAIGRSWPDPGEARRERLAVLFSGPWLYDDDDDADGDGAG